jgi:hypothetical protein
MEAVQETQSFAVSAAKSNSEVGQTLAAYMVEELDKVGESPGHSPLASLATEIFRAFLDGHQKELKWCILIKRNQAPYIPREKCRHLQLGKSNQTMRRKSAHRHQETKKCEPPPPLLPPCSLTAFV